MNQTACGIIRSYLMQNLKQDVMNETSVKKNQESLASKYLIKSVKNRLHLKKRLLFPIKEVSINDHINNYTELLADLANVDEVIGDKTKR